MKKLLAISLLFLLAYNMMGYYLMFAIRHYQVKKAVAQQIAQNSLSEDDLILIKVPVSLPYLTDWVDYEKVSGSFEYKGQFFEKVKQILRRDTLYVYCLEDKNQNHLFAELQQHTQNQLPDLINHLPNKSEQKQFPTFLKEYLSPQLWQFKAECTIFQSYFISYYQSSIYLTYLETSTPPPQFS